MQTCHHANYQTHSQTSNQMAGVSTMLIMCSQVGLAGPSGSGKTAFSEKVRSFIPGITVLSMDNYNDASRLIDGNFDGALDLLAITPTPMFVVGHGELL